MFATFKYTLSDNTPFSSIRVITWNVTNAINSASVYSKVTRSPVHIGELKMMCLLQSVPTPTSHITISPSFRSVLSTILVKKRSQEDKGKGNYKTPGPTELTRGVRAAWRSASVSGSPRWSRREWWNHWPPPVGTEEEANLDSSTKREHRLHGGYCD